MKLLKLANDCHELVIRDLRILFSYETPIAIHETKPIATDEYYSRTTSKHLNLWIKKHNFSNIEYVSPAKFRTILESIKVS